MERPMSFSHCAISALGGVAILEDHLEPSIVIEVGESKAAAILKKSPRPTGPETSENVPFAVVGNITFLRSPCQGRVRSNQFVDGVPPDARKRASRR